MITKRLYSKARKQSRTSPGAAIAAPLVEWLNRAMAKVQGNRQARESLIRVLEFAKAISKYTHQRTALESALKAAATEGMHLRAAEEMARRAADSEFDLHNELTAILARYTFVATVDGPNALRFRGHFDADSFTCLPSVINPDGFHEADAVLVVFQLAQQNYISNLRPCSQCLRFFYSSKSNQKFCPTRCRSHFWNATDKAKEARRIAARKRRAQMRDENRKYRTKKKSQGRLKPKRRTHK